MKNKEIVAQKTIVKNNKINVRFIINPISGTDKKKNIHSIIDEYFDKSKYNIDICSTELPEHATHLSMEASILKYDVVVAVGGDGTINEVGKGLVNSDTLLGVIPMGSGNGFASHLKIPKDISEALSVIKKMKHTSIDTFKINDNVSLGTAGIGFDAHIAWKFSGTKTRGFWSYARLVIKDYPHYKPQSFSLVVDGKNIVKQALLLSFANSSQYGSNIKIASSAKLDDGYIRIAILKNPPFYTLPLVFLMLRQGLIHKSKYYEILKCKKVEIKEKNIMAHIDGDPIYFSDGMKINVQPKSLKVLIP